MAIANTPINKRRVARALVMFAVVAFVVNLFVFALVFSSMEFAAKTSGHVFTTLELVVFAIALNLILATLCFVKFIEGRKVKYSVGAIFSALFFVLVFGVGNNEWSEALVHAVLSTVLWIASYFVFPVFRNSVRPIADSSLFSYFHDDRVKDSLLFILVTGFFAWGNVWGPLISAPVLVQEIPTAFLALSLLLFLKDYFFRDKTWLRNLAPLSVYVGFLFLALLSLDILLMSLFAFDPLAISGILQKSPARALLIILAVALILGPRPLLVFLALFIYAFGAGDAATIEESYNWQNWGSTHAIKPPLIGPTIGVSMVGMLLLMLSNYRVPPILFVAYGSLVSLALYLASSNWKLGLMAVVLVFAVLVLCNFVVQFFLENLKDMRAALGSVSAKRRWELFWKTIWLWAPAALLTIAGWNMNQAIKNRLQEQTYQNFPVVVSPKHEDLPPVERDLRIDVLYTVEVRRAAAISDYSRFVSERERRGERALDELPGEMSAFLEGQRPDHLPNGFCQGWKKKYVGSARGWCRDLVGGVDGSIQNSFTRGRNNIMVKVEETVSRTDLTFNKNMDLIRQSGIREIHNTHNRIAQFFVLLFLVLAILQFVAALYLISSLLSGFNVIAGRVLFNSVESQGERSRSFRLARGSERHVNFQLFDQCNLLDQSLSGARDDWYVYRKTSRKGNGTHFRPTFARTIRAAIRRIFSGRFVLTFVETSAKSIKDLRDDQAPRISKSGDRRLVALNLEPGQQIVFRMRDLSAFSGKVKIRSVYSTHVAANLMGLGRFYCIAHVGPSRRPYDEPPVAQKNDSPDSDCRGTLILQSVGDEVHTLAKTQSTPDAFLAWDQSTEFSAVQQLTQVGVWLAPPDLKGSDKSSVIWHEREGANTSVIRNILRLLAYMLLPF